jgi:CheY-like chemotaxis protein
MLNASHLLIAEPNQHMAGLIVTVLRSIGVHSITTVNDGPALLMALQRNAFAALIINDWLGPVDGIDIVRKIRAAETAGRCLPIVMVFSEASRGRIEEARDAGVTELVRKPLSATILEARLAQAIEHPRPIIREDSYAGPDRRRHTNGAGNRRRADDPTAA